MGFVVRDQRPSEFGGVPGLVQPYPHDPTTVEHEILREVYATNPDPPLYPTAETEQVVPVTQRKRR